MTSSPGLKRGWLKETIWEAGRVLFCMPAEAFGSRLNVHYPQSAPSPPRVDKIHVGLVKELLRKSWCAETATRGKWSPEVPSLNQCAVSALVVQDLLGGELLRCEMTNRDSHYWNRLPDGREVDLTTEQFEYLGAYPRRETMVVRNRAYVLSYPDTMRRYAILLQRVAYALWPLKTKNSAAP